MVLLAVLVEFSWNVDVVLLKMSHCTNLISRARKRKRKKIVYKSTNIDRKKAAKNIYRKKESPLANACRILTIPEKWADATILGSTAGIEWVRISFNSCFFSLSKCYFYWRALFHWMRLAFGLIHTVWRLAVVLFFLFFCAHLKPMMNVWNLKYIQM